MRDAGYQAEISNGASLGNAGFIVVAISTSPKWDSPSGVAYMRRHLIPGLHRCIQLSLWCGLCVWNAMSGLGHSRRLWHVRSMSGYGVISEVLPVHEFTARWNIPIRMMAQQHLGGRRNAGHTRRISLVN